MTDETGTSTDETDTSGEIRAKSSTVFPRHPLMTTLNFSVTWLKSPGFKPCCAQRVRP